MDVKALAALGSLTRLALRGWLKEARRWVDLSPLGPLTRLASLSCFSTSSDKQQGPAPVLRLQGLPAASLQQLALPYNSSLAPEDCLALCALTRLTSLQAGTLSVGAGRARAAPPLPASLRCLALTALEPEEVHDAVWWLRTLDAGCWTLDAAVTVEIGLHMLLIYGPLPEHGALGGLADLAPPLRRLTLIMHGDAAIKFLVAEDVLPCLLQLTHLQLWQASMQPECFADTRLAQHLLACRSLHSLEVLAFEEVAPAFVRALLAPAELPLLQALTLEECIKQPRRRQARVWSPSNSTSAALLGECLRERAAGGRCMPLQLRTSLLLGYEAAVLEAQLHALGHTDYRVTAAPRFVFHTHNITCP